MRRDIAVLIAVAGSYWLLSLALQFIEKVHLGSDPRKYRTYSSWGYATLATIRKRPQGGQPRHLGAAGFLY